MIKAAHHAQISIPIGAENEARRFYCGVLGLTEIPKPDALAGRGGFWLQLNGFQVHFGTEDGVDRRKTKGHIAYLVEGLDTWHTKITESGGEVIDGIPIPGYKRFEFRDPFGNRVEFIEKIN